MRKSGSAYVNWSTTDYANCRYRTQTPDINEVMIAGRPKTVKSPLQRAPLSCEDENIDDNHFATPRDSVMIWRCL